MRVLVTGGAGFIGSHLIEALSARGDTVQVLDDLSTGREDNLATIARGDNVSLAVGSIVDPETVQRLVSRAELVFHLAAAVGVRTVLDRPLDSLLTNLRGTEIVLEACSRSNVPVLVASTSEVYGKNDAGPLDEDSDRILGSSQISRWHYATAKAADEALALSYNADRGLQTMVIRLFNTVGPRQTGRYGMVVPRLVSQALANEPLTVYGDGQQTRCFTYVGDTVRCLLALVGTPAAWGDVFNIGYPFEVSIEQLARTIIAKTGSSSAVVFVPYAQAYGGGFEDMRRRVPNVDKLRRTIGFAPDTPLDVTLDRIIESLRQNPL